MSTWNLRGARATACAFLLTVTSTVFAQTEAPVIGPVFDQESAYRLPPNIPEHGEYHVTIQNNPTTITATGYPDGVRFSGSIDAVFAWSEDTFTGGDYTVTITATNSAGSATKSFRWIVHPGLSDFIRTDKTSYTVGDTITFTAKFSAPVVVTGSPYLPLWGTKQASYVDGSGTNTLHFEYTVAADDPLQTGLYASQVEPGDGTIATADGVSARNLTATSNIVSSYPTFSIVAPPPPGPPVFQGVPTQRDDSYGEYGNIGQFSELRIQVANAPRSITASGFPPGISAVSSSSSISFLWIIDQLTGGQFPVTLTATNAAGTTTANFLWIIHPGLRGYLQPDKTTYDVGDTLTLTATFSAPVIVTGSPYIALWGAKRAEYAGGSGTSTLIFRCPIVGADAPQSGVSASAITLGDGSIATADGTSVGKLTIQQSISSVVPTFSVAAAPPPPGPVPVLSDAIAVGQVGTPITPVELQATNSPMSFTADAALADYGLQVSTSGIVSGTPTKAASAVQISCTAANGSGSSAPAALTLAIAPGGAAPTLDSAVGPETATSSGAWTWSGIATPGAQVWVAELASPDQAIEEQESATGVIANANGHWSLALNVPTAAGTYQFAAAELYPGTSTQISGRQSAPQTVTVAAAPPPPTSAPAMAVGGGTDFGSVTVGESADRTYTITNTGTAVLNLTSPVAVSGGNAADFTVTAQPASATVEFAGGGLTTAPTSVAFAIRFTPSAAGARSTRVLIPSNDPNRNPYTLTLTGTGVAPTPPPPPPPAKADQTITFTSPVSAIIVGQPITLGALSSAGLPITYTIVSGDATISGNVLTPTSTATLVVRASAAGSDAYNAASTDVNFGAPRKAAQVITVATTGGDVMAGQPVGLSATSSSGLPVTYTVVSGPATISGDTLTFTGTGAVTVRASQSGSATYAAADNVTLTFTAHPIPRLINVSSRVHLAVGDVAIAGFVVTGSAPKRLLVRAVGDSLVPYGITDPLADPRLTLYDSNRAQVAGNAGWAGDAQVAAAGAAAGAFSLTPGGTDAALIATLSPGAYTAQVTAPGAGTVLLEVYDLAANAAVPTKQLINVSTRSRVDAASPIVEGFVIAGDQPKRVLVRAIGPTLAQYGVTDALADPRVAIYSGQTILAQNDDWGTQQALVPGQPTLSAEDIAAANAATGAFPLPAESKDAAVVLTLPAGAYTAVATGGGSGSGEVLVEVYEVP